MFKKTLTNIIEPLINNRFNQLNQSIEDMKGLQIVSIQNLQDQITNLNLDDLDIPSACDIASEISADEIANYINSYDIGRAIEIDASDISIDPNAVASYIEIDPYDVARNISARDIASNIQIDANDIAIDWSIFTNAVAELSAKLTAIETQVATLSKPKATKKPTVKKPVAKKPTGKTTAKKKPVAKKAVTTKKATAKK